MKPETRGALVCLAAIIGAMWLADSLGDLIAGPTDATGTVREGEVRTAPVATSSSPTPGLGGPRVHAAKASRSRTAAVTSTLPHGTLAEITCYSSGSITASGKTPQVGMVATLDRGIPFGTRIHIASLGTYVVEDRVGHSSDYDIYGPSEAFCRDFGRKHLLVSVLG